MKKIVSRIEKHNKEEEGEKRVISRFYCYDMKFNIGSQRAKEQFLQNSKGT